ncbi:MAG TPA: hypothetical protein VG052_17215 [Puia sp.]|jgi:hypothetical protein|nr:hypothetical protein [Puia sp.]
MQKLSGFLLLLTVVGFTACKGHEKKILVYASSDIQVDNTKQHITVTDGGPHHEQELDFSGSDPVTLDAQTPLGKVSVSAAEDGLYILNLKSDTVIGSFQHVGADNGQPRITQDAAKQKLDSLQKLVQDQNVSDANRNYFIAPGKMVKISSNPQAKVFGPFTTIPGSFDAGSVPEIYKFYSINEVREIIDNLQKMTK